LRQIVKKPYICHSFSLGCAIFLAQLFNIRRGGGTCLPAGRLVDAVIFMPEKFFQVIFVRRGGGIGRRTGLKILWVFIPVPVRVRPSVLCF
jgi:hypothetical protein